MCPSIINIQLIDSSLWTVGYMLSDSNKPQEGQVELQGTEYDWVHYELLYRNTHFLTTTTAETTDIDAVLLYFPSCPFWHIPCDCVSSPKANVKALAQRANAVNVSLLRTTRSARGSLRFSRRTEKETWPWMTSWICSPCWVRWLHEIWRPTMHLKSTVSVWDVCAFNNIYHQQVRNTSGLLSKQFWLCETICPARNNIILT